MEKPVLIPTEIRLDELPEEGRTYTYTKDSAELNIALADLIGQRPYVLEVTVRPIGNAYEVTGSFKTTKGAICYRCAEDLELSLTGRFNEILVVEKERPRTGRSTKNNHSSEWLADGIFCNYIPAPIFSVPEFAHEQIASSEPLQPRRDDDCELGLCENYKKALASGHLDALINPEVEKTNPFSALKGLNFQKS